MPKKRRSRGRSKGWKGRSSFVQYCACGELVPRDKIKRVTRYSSFVDRTLARELRIKDAFISRYKIDQYYCISCAVHRRIVKVRAKSKRNYK